MRKILTLLASLAFLEQSSAQEPKRAWEFTTDLVQLSFLNINVGVDRRLNKHSFGVFAAYRPSLKQSGTVQATTGFGGDYFSQNSWNWLYESTTIGVRYKIRPWPKRGIFWELDAFYRYWWFDRKQTYFDNRGYFDGLRSERQQVQGLKLLLGSRLFVNKQPQGRNRLIMEGFVGPGCRWKTIQFLTHEGMVGDTYRTEYMQHYNSFIPALEFGIRVGLGVHGKVGSTDDNPE